MDKWGKRLAYAQFTFVYGANPLLMPKIPLLVVSAPCLCRRPFCLWCQTHAYAQQTFFGGVQTRMSWCSLCPIHCSLCGKPLAHVQ